ncbi:DUF3248 domain-containing protein [Deinococcus sp. YIM 77859]|uniref:DUF3248 domain-containing protein n=1 Tax=Deinococcus sp. YIM 77859 TaxID=1540221 RepID=UPI000552B894|nr:DUF3248 domain-containing protein [Deinococcus sp. YIM 77859]
MTDAPFSNGAAPDLPPELARQLEALGGQLVWRVGKDELNDDVVVRLGYASATPRFAHLPRLRSVADAELQAALAEHRLVIEWVD